eukprot:scaffold54408_cov60-Phaeocystis_antarctica.AAC.2
MSLTKRLPSIQIVTRYTLVICILTQHALSRLLQPPALLQASLQSGAQPLPLLLNSSATLTRRAGSLRRGAVRLVGLAKPP